MFPQKYFMFVNFLVMLGLIGTARLGLPYPYNLAEALMVFPWKRDDSDRP